MLAIKDLREIAAARLHDARVLYAAECFEGAFYLCGYAVELSLKARICKNLRWPGFPESNKEFERLSSFRVHDLEVLLKLTGYEATIKGNYFAAWSKVKLWQPDVRYRPVGTATAPKTKIMLDAVAILLRKL